MFKLDGLQLSGFKSFVDPVALDFAGGMTGIVGPNGCGKSNVCDAVCWVLGERSAKALRGETMEDVIFSGTQGRKPIGMAEVELTLITDSSFEHAEDGRLTIGRRVHRSGESQYLLNGKTVRLKEIRDLLMDTGLGLRAYSVIEQGRIGQILSGKPQERRRLIEEAAGITKYKERRRVAEIKLEETKSNLSRLDDIVSEVERSLRSLKRQAGAARRFQERRSAYRELLERVLTGRWGDLSARLREIEERLGTATDREAEYTASLRSREAELLAGRENLDEMSRRLAATHRREAELAAQIEGRQEFIKGSRQRLEEITDRGTSGRALADNRRQQISVLREQLEILNVRTESLRKERDAAMSEVSEDDQRISEVERSAAEAERQLETLRQRLLHSIGDVNGLRNRLHREQVEREKGELQLRHLADELAEKLRDLEESGEQLAGADTAHAQLLGRVRAEESKLEELEERLEGTIAERRSLTERRSAAVSRQDALRHRREVLAELEHVQRARRDDMRRALAAAGIDEPRFLGDELDVPAGWERSLDLFLGALEDAVVLPENADGLALARALTEGRVTGHLLETGLPGRGEEAEIDDPAVGLSVAEALGIPDTVATALPVAYFVESRWDARRLARLHPGIAFVSRDRMWAQGGVLHVQGEAARPGALAREHELAGIAIDLPPLESEVESCSEEIERYEAEEGELRDRRERLIESLAELRKELAVAAARKDDLEKREKRLSVERSTLETEQIEIDQTLALLNDRASGLEDELERASAHHDRLENEMDAMQKRVDAVRDQRETTRTSGVSRRGNLDLIDHRLESHLEEVARTERDIDEASGEIDAWSAEQRRLEERSAEIRNALAAAEDDLQQALDGRETARTEALGEQQKLDEERETLTALERGIEEARGERDEIREGISDLRVEKASLRQDAEHLAEQYREHFEEKLPDDPPPVPDNLEEMEVDLERLRERLERTGPVNLLAAEEFEEQQKRHEFLTEQRADVARSLESLRTTIREINETSSTRFLDAFLEINESFSRTFVELFRGGQAEMRLLDEEDVLESGIEIVARPPGKRLQNIMLLSGGEKALTAIALLFALFRTKPSPFCILDEVDAPLDDVNTLRFVEMLKQMSTETQFIVITHNKLTMEAMSRLYGVTMQERGVSSLVTVDFDDLHPNEEAVSA
jgi:chromosome segregation protein